MKENLKYLLPKFFIDYYIYLRSIFFTNRRVLSLNKASKNNHLGKKVIVLGNGPSVLNFPIEDLKKFPVIVMNDFYKSSLVNDIHPIAYCVGEPVTSDAFVNPNIFLDSNSSSTFWFPLSYKGYIQNTTEKINYFHSGIEADLFNEKEIDLSKITLAYQTTAQVSIQVAMHMGFEEIYLLGFDHNWLAEPKFSRHFFSDEKQDNDIIESYSYLKLISFCKRMWEIYEKMRVISNKSRQHIFNISENSFLDVFEFKKCNEVRID